MSTIFTKSLIFAIVCVSLSGCGDDAEEASTPQVNNKLIIIDKSNTPVVNMIGVSLNIDGADIYFLVKEGFGNANALNIKIDKELNKSADKSDLLGKGFLKFDGLTNSGEIAAIKGVKVNGVSECSIETKICESIPLLVENGITQFDIKSQKYYALEK
ncbi:hypothetical protein H6769_01665 [Candidatus Peribacteria bacterium]|nr:hypothetical protein [Candidatus Peribacteria bacterium]